LAGTVHYRFEIIIEDGLGHTAEELEGAMMAIDQNFASCRNGELSINEPTVGKYRHEG